MFSRRVIFWTLTYFVSFGFVLDLAAKAGSHPFDVRDSIQMVRFSDPSDFDREATAQLSPDGKYALVVTSRGLIARNQIESTLRVFRIRDARRILETPTRPATLTGTVLARITATPSGAAVMTYSPVILDARWSADSRFIYFLGLDAGGERRLYRVDVEGKAARSLTRKGQDVERYDLERDTVIYSTVRMVQSATENSGDRRQNVDSEMRPLTGLPLQDVLCSDRRQPAQKVSETRCITFVKNGRSVDRIFGKSGRTARHLPPSGIDKAHSSVPLPVITVSVTIFVHQGINSSPTLWATNTSSGTSREIWDPNPQFAALEFGEASIYTWTDKSGYHWTGDLIKPVGYVTGKRYPLIIQTHGFSDYRFISDGSYPTSMAARPFASAGFVVLQMDYRRDHELTAMETQDQCDGFLSAIRELSAAGTIDPTRVGIIGFSRTAYHVEAALIAAPEAFAAATIADGVDQSYMQYHLWGEGNHGLAAEFERANGGTPFGEARLINWLKHSPGFHLDRVAVPLRLEALGGPLSILGEWEIYSSLRMQQKPVDLVYIRGAQHILQKPLDRLASEEGDVDWFRFWLQNYEDPNPSKTAEYKRWHELRRLADRPVPLNQ